MAAAVEHETSGLQEQRPEGEGWQHPSAVPCVARGGAFAGVLNLLAVVSRMGILVLVVRYCASKRAPAACRVGVDATGCC